MLDPDAVFADPALLAELFPPERTNEFFDALFGDPEEGAYNIALRYGGSADGGRTLTFFFDLHQRPGKCLACNLTSGLPEVFGRHPVIGVKALAAAVAGRLGRDAACADWALGRTIQEERTRFCIPLTITLAES